MKAPLLALVLLGAGTLAAAQAPAAKPCPERIREFDERRAAVRQAQDQAAAESEELSRRTQALDAERAATDNNNKREIGLYNVRAREHAERVVAHNQRLEAVNADIAAVNRDLATLRAECAPKKPPS